jgi:hypothetical protein
MDAFAEIEDGVIEMCFYKLQCCLAPVKSCCELWNMKINEDKAEVMYFS